MSEESIHLSHSSKAASPLRDGRCRSLPFFLSQCISLHEAPFRGRIIRRCQGYSEVVSDKVGRCVDINIHFAEGQWEGLSNKQIFFRCPGRRDLPLHKHGKNDERITLCDLITGTLFIDCETHNNHNGQFPNLQICIFSHI